MQNNFFFYDELLKANEKKKQKNKKIIQEQTQRRAHRLMSFLSLYENKLQHEQKCAPVAPRTSLPTKGVPTTTDGSEKFTDEYQSILSKCDARMLELSQQLGIQHESRSTEICYLKNNNFFHKNSKLKKTKKKTKAVAPPSDFPLRCTFFVGGKANFPFGCWPKVYHSRAVDILGGRILFDNDIAHSKEGVRMFLELDYTSKSGIVTPAQMMEHARQSQYVIGKFFPAADKCFWLLTSPPKSKYVKYCVQPLLKCGAHVVFPNIVVDCEKGKQLCHSINIALQLKFGLFNAVDNCFKREIACLRPAWAHKLTDCGMCHNCEEERHRCEICAGRGKIVHGAVYTPYAFAKDNGRVSMYTPLASAEKLAEVLACTSIVPYTQRQYTPGYRHPFDEPRIVRPDQRCPKLNPRQRVIVSKSEIKSQNRMRFGRMTSIDDPERLFFIETAIAAYGCVVGMYSNQVIASARETKNHEIFVDLKSRDCRLCRIVDENGHNHRSNRIFFRLSKKTNMMYQSCYKEECRTAFKNEASIKTNLEKRINAQVYKKIFSA